MMKSNEKTTLYASIDLHSATSVLGGMTRDGKCLPTVRFDTSAHSLRKHVSALSKDYSVTLAVESAPLARWAREQLKSLVKKFIICDPRRNKLISSSAHKKDELDVDYLCRLLRMGELHEVWCGDDEQRQIFRESVQALLNFRDQQRELKTLIKTRFRGFGILKLNGKEIFHPQKRQRWIALIPAGHNKGLTRLYGILDITLKAWQEQMREVNELGKNFSEISHFQQIPGIGEIGSAVFSAIIEDPHRFKSASSLYTYSALGITSRSSDNKPLGYQRIHRRGQRELKNLSYHAWRTGIRIGSQSPCVRQFYEASKIRTGSTRHARLNTQRKILKTLWVMWKNGSDFDPTHFLPNSEPEAQRSRRRRKRRRHRTAKTQPPSD